MTYRRKRPACESCGNRRNTTWPCDVCGIFVCKWCGLCQYDEYEDEEWLCLSCWTEMKALRVGQSKVFLIGDPLELAWETEERAERLDEEVLRQGWHRNYTRLEKKNLGFRLPDHSESPEERVESLKQQIAILEKELAEAQHAVRIVGELKRRLDRIVGRVA